ncbi:MAG: penicillin-binding protein 2 [Anaerolineae bacterium]|nr:penicillin-binding protein 2 [Anaerolineae bacterium]MDK1080449.1 penicillin-binding protein 2 [Anaerolineae bacterium]
MNTLRSSNDRIPPYRLRVIYAIVLIVLGALLFRLISLQITQGEVWLDQSIKNFTTTVSIPPARGIIYDRNGFILARNIPSYNVVITPANLPDSDADTQSIYRSLSQLIDIPATQGTIEDAILVAECVPGPGIEQLVALGESLAPFRPVRVGCDVDDEIARIVRELAVDWPGVSVEVDPIRDYPTGSLTANVVGFLGPIPASLEGIYRDLGFVPNRDKIGYAGVETSLDDILTGTPGRRTIQVDVAGKELRNLEPPIAPEPGENLRLTIDSRLQAATEAVLLTEIQAWNDFFGRIRISSGVIIAMNPKTGEVLAMVTYPTYENNRMARFIPATYFNQLSQDPRRPLLNNAIQAEYPPGSVFKISTAVGAINEEIVTLDQEIFAPGQLLLCEKFSPNDPCTDRNTRPFVDWIFETNPDGFGILNFFRCIAYSSNVCFYKLGGGFEEEIEEGLGVERLGEYARAIGYGEKSGIELIGEQDGLIPSPRWKRINQGENWSTGDTYLASVGQGYVLSTPLQVLMSAATIANDGKLMQPTIVREVTDSDGRVVERWFNPEDFSVTERPTPGSYQISPFIPNTKWDTTVTPMIQGYSCFESYCTLTEDVKVVQPSSINSVQTGMRMAVTEELGTLNKIFGDFPIAVAGKTGTAEYCDDVALKANRCQFGQWPTHSWTLAYAPFDDPEIIILAFAYNGGEGASVAGPMVYRTMEAYFELKSIDIAQGGGG